MKALFVDPSNRRCVDCHALSPHYVVCGFGVFVCTRCSGVHSSFGHRIKGITVAEFTEEEVDRLARAGNGAFGRLYLGSLPKGYMKPHEMGLDEVRQWIEDVYVKKLYYKKPVDQAQAAVGAVAAGPADRPAARPAYLDIPEEEIALVPLADILGANTPILRVESKGAAEAGQVAGIVRKQEEEAARAAKPSVSIDILDGWDPFGDEERTTAREAQEGGSPVREDGRSPPELPGPSFQDEWATFIDDVKEENHGEQEVPFVPDRESLFLEQEVKDVKGPLPLEAFLDPAEAQMKQLQRRSKIDASVPSRTVPPPVPLETFFPEFEEIRRTGVLPTGVPDPTRLAPRFAPRLAPVSAAPARASPARVEEPPAAAPYSLATSAVPSAVPSAADAADRASHTLGYGNPFEGYDLRAAYAPKASESGGNPFA